MFRMIRIAAIVSSLAYLAASWGETHSAKAQGAEPGSSFLSSELSKSTGSTFDSWAIDIPANRASSLNHLAHYVSASSDATARLRAVGYSHSEFDDKVWRSLTADEQISAAYMSAEKAAPGGGERMLAMMSRNLAQDYESVAFHPNLSEFVRRGNSISGQIAFARLATDPKTAAAQVGPEARAAIGKLSYFCEGGIRSALTNHFGLSSVDTMHILLNHRGTTAEMLESAYAKAGARDGNLALKSLIMDADTHYEGARAISEFKAWRTWVPHEKTFAEHLKDLYPLGSNGGRRVAPAVAEIVPKPSIIPAFFTNRLPKAGVLAIIVAIGVGVLYVTGSVPLALGVAGGLLALATVMKSCNSSAAAPREPTTAGGNPKSAASG